MKGYDGRGNRIAQTHPIDATIIGVRLVIAFIGLICMIIGIMMIIKVFNLFYAFLAGPSTLAATFDAWAKALGGNELAVDINGKSHPLARVLTVVILCVGSVFLTYLSTGVMTTGAKMIHHVSDELLKVRQALLSPPADYPPAEERPYMGSRLDEPSPPDANSTLD